MVMFLKNLMVLSFAIFLVACGGGSSYQDLSKNDVASTFSPTDQKLLVNEVTQKLLQNQAFAAEIGNSRPTLLIDVIKNKTSEQIDTESMTDTIKASILNSRLFRIVNRNNLNILAQEQALNELQLTDAATATRLGKLWGAQYVLYGNFSSTVNYVGSQKQTYYKFTLVVQNIETGEEVWVGESEVNKITKKGLF